MRIARHVCGAFALALAVVPAHAAAPLRDEASGLAVQPPEGYEANVAEADPRYAAVFAVQKGEEADSGCKVAFQAAPPPESKTGESSQSPKDEVELSLGIEVKPDKAPAPTQEDINTFVRKKEWMDLIRATLALRYEVVTLEPFEQSGVVGAAVVADFKPIEGEPRASEVRSYIVLIDTPKGRTTVVCVEEKAKFDARKPEFEAIARGVSPPR